LPLLCFVRACPETARSAKQTELFYNSGVHRSAEKRQARERAVQGGNGCLVDPTTIRGTSISDFGGVFDDQLGPELAG